MRAVALGCEWDFHAYVHVAVRAAALVPWGGMCWGRAAVVSGLHVVVVRGSTCMGCAGSSEILT